MITSNIRVFITSAKKTNNFFFLFWQIKFEFPSKTPNSVGLIVPSKIKKYAIIWGITTSFLNNASWCEKKTKTKKIKGAHKKEWSDWLRLFWCNLKNSLIKWCNLDLHKLFKQPGTYFFIRLFKKLFIGLNLYILLLTEFWIRYFTKISCIVWDVNRVVNSVFK